jgi:hypothetical protein
MGSVTGQVSLLVATVLFASAASAETIYYAVSEGENYGSQRWHVGDLQAFNHNRPGSVFDLYTCQRLADGGLKVIRERTTPSGDWSLTLTYRYGTNGRLGKILYDFSTFNGMCPCGETGPIRCERTYLVDAGGKLRKTMERITNMNTGILVDWTFSEPTVKHWRSVAELPIKPR